MRTRADLIGDLEQRGEEAVKIVSLNGEYKGLAHEAVREWLSSKAHERSEVRSKESLVISRKAFRNSNWANVMAAIAIVVAVIAIVIACVQKK